MNAIKAGTPHIVSAKRQSLLPLKARAARMQSLGKPFMYPCAELGDNYGTLPCHVTLTSHDAEETVTICYK